MCQQATKKICSPNFITNTMQVMVDILEDSVSAVNEKKLEI